MRLRFSGAHGEAFAAYCERLGFRIDLEDALVTVFEQFDEADENPAVLEHVRMQLRAATTARQAVLDAGAKVLAEAATKQAPPEPPAPPPVEPASPAAEAIVAWRRMPPPPVAVLITQVTPHVLPQYLDGLPSWRIARAQAAGRSAGDKLRRGHSRVTRTSRAGPKGEEIPSSQYWVVLHSLPGKEVGVFCRWHQGAAPQVITQSGDPGSDTVFHGMPTLTEVGVYCRAAERDVPDALE